MENWTEEQIERYLDGDMSTLERQTFEADLGQNPDLVHSLENHHLVRDAVGVLMRENIADIYVRVRKKTSWSSRWSAYMTDLLYPLKQTLLGLYRKLSNALSSDKQGFAYIYRPLAWAAACMLPLLFGLNLYTERNCSDTAIFADMYVPEMVSTTMGDEQTTFKEGFSAYKKGDFQTAIRYFKAVPSTDAKYTDAGFYLGHSLLQVKDYPAAVAAFDRVIADQQSPFRQNAEWNRLLAMLGMGKSNDPAFRAALHKIAEDPAHNYHTSADELRKKLDGLLRKVFL